MNPAHDYTQDTIVTLEDHYHLTPVGLIVEGSPTLEQHNRAGARIKDLHGSSPWCYGDWQNDGERRYGDTYTQGVEETEYTLQGLADVAWVARSWPIEERDPRLSFSHHRVLTPVSKPIRAVLMPLALASRWTVAELKQAKDNYLLGNGPITDAQLRAIEDGDSPLPDDADPAPGHTRPRLCIASAGRVLKMDDHTITVDCDSLPKEYLDPGAGVYVQISYIPPELA